MKKKAYILPVTTAVTIEPHLLKNISGETNADMTIRESADESDVDNRSRRSFNVWGGDDTFD